MKKHNKRKCAAALAAALLLTAALTGCSEQTPETTPTAAVTEPAAPATTAPSPTEPAVPDVVVETPYCPLHIPGEWGDRIHVEQYEFEVGMSAIFFGELDGMQIELYAIHFGGAEGIPVGTFGQLDVTAQLAEFAADGSWDAAAADEVSAMQETMNHVIDCLKAEPGITPAA